MENTEYFKKFIHCRNLYSTFGARKALKGMTKARNALKDAGCYSKNSERMRQNAFILDHIDQIKDYIKRAGNAEACDDKFYEELVNASMPTKPKTLRSMIRKISKKKNSRETAKNNRRSGKKPHPLAAKYVYASIVHSGDVCQEEIDVEFAENFQRAANQ